MSEVTADGFKFLHALPWAPYETRKMKCECGAVVRTHSIAIHRVSQKHIRLMNELLMLQTAP